MILRHVISDAQTWPFLDNQKDALTLWFSSYLNTNLDLTVQLM